MTGTTIALIAMGSIFGGTLIGVALRQFVPEHHLKEDSRDAIKVGAGMISMMAALVLGLLVSSAKSKYDSANSAITEAGAKVIVLDRVLDSYGPETSEMREQLRRGIDVALALLWPEELPRSSGFGVFEQRASPMERLQERIRSLQPQTGSQRALQEEAQKLVQDLLLLRWLQIEQAQTGLAMPFLIILLFWLTMLYTSFGLLAPRNGTVLAALFIAALSLATAIFLIVEMNQPMGGALKVSSGPMRKALQHLGK